MSPEILLLCGTAASIAFIHTLAGPDHYLPFVALAKSGQWSMGMALRNTFICGSGHIVGSVALGFAGIYASVHLDALEWIQGFRGDLAAWALVSFGLLYMAWGLHRVVRNRTHTHWHSHGKMRHCHAHDHHSEHSHLHTTKEAGEPRQALAGWAIFIVFILGPCEPLIPVLMYPAAEGRWWWVGVVVLVFGAVTVTTMLVMVTFGCLGLAKQTFRHFERYSHALAGLALVACGLGIQLNL